MEGRRRGLLQTVAKRCRGSQATGAAHPTFESINRLAREYKLKEYFDGACAVAPGGTGVIRRANFDRLKRVSHAGRLATMGHLAASVAHEIN